MKRRVTPLGAADASTPNVPPATNGFRISATRKNVDAEPNAIAIVGDRS
jgi:hypothetical protein